MGKVAAFGELFDLVPKVGRNVMQILDFNNSLYVIGVSEAVIYRYSYDGKLISFKDFRKEDFLAETINIQTEYYNKNSGPGLSTIFQSATIVNGKILVIFFHRKKSGSQYNEVLVFDSESYELTKIYELGDERGFYICISPSLTSKNGFLTFNVLKASIELYDLE